MNNSIVKLDIRRSGSVWVFTDDSVGLHDEPFVCGAETMIDFFVPKTINAAELFFSGTKFPACDTINFIGHGDGGNYYEFRSKILKHKLWLCPALFKYFPEAPWEIYFKVDYRRRK